MLLAVVLAACVPDQSGATTTVVAGPAPERHEGAAGRLDAALQDKAAEQARIVAAQEYRASGSESERLHTVSLADPVAVSDFVDAVAVADLIVQTTHLWFQSPGSIEVATGIIESAGGGPPADSPAFVEHLETVYSDHLIGDQHLRVFGLVCSCSQQQIDQFEAQLGVGAVRAVEVHGHATRMPIWPQDPVRDAIIDSGGTYGR